MISLSRRTLAYPLVLHALDVFRFVAAGLALLAMLPRFSALKHQTEDGRARL